MWIYHLVARNFRLLAVALSLLIPSLAAGSTIWSATTVPGTVDSGPDSAVELGVKFRADSSGFITGIRFYKASTNTGTHIGNLWTTSGTRLATATFAGETASGWQQVNFSTPVAITANTVYVASYHTNTGHYSDDQNYFAGKGMDSPPLHALANGVSSFDGVYHYGSASGFPNLGWNSSNYWVDVSFNTTAPPPPTLSSIAVTPANPTIQSGTTQQFTATGTYSDGSTQNLSSQTSWASSNTGIATITSTGLATAANAGSTTISATLNAILGSTSLTVQVPTLTITTASLPGGAPNASYLATLTAVGGQAPITWSLFSGSLPTGLSLSGTGSISGTPTLVGTFNFTVQATDSGSPGQIATKGLSIVIAAQATYTIWSAATVPGTVDSGPDSAVELGVKFRADSSGFITGIRFYKASTNTGTHIGNLWSISGTRLATATFAGETASGWQQVNFSTPVAITANTVYVASYHTNTGHYSDDQNYFAGKGMDSPPLHALANGVSSFDGVYAYGSASSFPTLGWNSSNYWVDVVFNTTVPITISGTITPANSGTGTLVTLNGPNQSVQTTTADATGKYSFTSLSAGSYTVTPTKAGYTFTPTSQPVVITTTSVVANFTATPNQTFTISGSVTPSTEGSGTLLTLSGSPSVTTTADSSGNFSFTGLGNGTYTITPSKTGDNFTPTSQTVVINGGNVSGVGFTAAPIPPPPLNYPDLSDVIPTAPISIAGTGANRVLQYTHDTFNGGTGPLVIQPSLNPASGQYMGVQYIYRFSNGTWTLAQQIPVAGAFIFSSDHAHFHFPFATYGLYTVAANGGIGTPVALSPKIEFCIADSFIYAPTLPNAGALGNLGPCTDPTSLRGLDIGAVDEYDRTDPGQTISLAGVPDGTYWLRAIDDPDNFLFESDKSNNETDVQLSISGTSVTVLRVANPVLPAPPTVSLTFPADQAAVSGTVGLTASTAIGSPVQFLLDGAALGAPIATTPYLMSWDTTTVPNGVHWLAAQTTDPATGRTGTSAVARVTVNNVGAALAPIVTLNAVANATVSATVTVGATVADAATVTNVQFYVDSQPVGAPLTAPPYLKHWDTTAFAQGEHQLTASATNSLKLTSTSEPVTVTVDNSHPANTIGIDATVFRDGGNTMTTPPFSTTTDSDLLVAFVAYDGPATSPQSATVSGAGLTWTLVKRSNMQRGTSEIWVAKAGEILSNVTVLSQPGVTGYRGSLVVVAFTNAQGTGVVGQSSAPSGAPDIYLPGVEAGSWVFAVGNASDSAIGRSPTSGQVLVHQAIDTRRGDTYWVQSTAAPSTGSGLVDIHDDAPTSDQWNYTAVEILATHR